MRAASLREIILHICRRCSSREVLFLMEDRSRNLPSTSDTARGMHGRALGGIHSASSIDKFFEAPSEAAIAEAMRPILLWATSPIVAWLAPGDSFSSNVLHQVGETFRRNRAGAVLVPKRGSFTERPAGQAGNLDFGFLSAQ